jgi:hypothetical protein
LGEIAAATRLFSYANQKAGVVVLASTSNETLERGVLEKHPRTPFARLDIPIGPGYCHLAYRGLWRPSKAESLSIDHGSEANYWLEGLVVIRHDLKCGWKIYSLRRQRETSEHCHPEDEEGEETTETFYRIAGDPSIVLNEVKQDLGDRLVVPPPTWHKLVANDQTAVIMIEIEGPDPLGTSNHQYRE